MSGSLYLPVILCFLGLVLAENLDTERDFSDLSVKMTTDSSGVDSF